MPNFLFPSPSFSSWEDQVHPGRGGWWPPASSALHRAGWTTGCGWAGDGVEGDSQVSCWSECLLNIYIYIYTRIYRAVGSIQSGTSCFTVLVHSVEHNPLWIRVFCMFREIGWTLVNSQSTLICSRSVVPVLWDQEMGGGKLPHGQNSDSGSEKMKCGCNSVVQNVSAESGFSYFTCEVHMWLCYFCWTRISYQVEQKLKITQEGQFIKEISVVSV